jgi:hypothetical protein
MPSVAEALDGAVQTAIMSKPGEEKGWRSRAKGSAGGDETLMGACGVDGDGDHGVETLAQITLCMVLVGDMSQ